MAPGTRSRIGVRASSAGSRLIYPDAAKPAPDSPGNGPRDIDSLAASDTSKHNEINVNSQAQIARAGFHAARWRGRKMSAPSNWAFPFRLHPIAAKTSKEWPVERLQELVAEAIARGTPIQHIPCFWRHPAVATMMADHRPRLAVGSFGCSQIGRTA